MTDIHIFEPDGRAIPYAVEGHGPALVLMPGLGMNVSYLGTLAASVAAEDFRVVRIGARRPSSEADAVVTMRELAQDVVDVMDHVGVADAWVGGHAFGGSIARAVSLAHSQRVNGVLLLGVEKAGEVTDTGALPEIPAHARDAEVASMLRTAGEASAGEFAALAAGVPVLVVQGADDQITPAVNGEDLRASAPELVSVVRVEGGAHLFPATHVGATSWAIEDYLDWD